VIDLNTFAAPQLEQMPDVGFFCHADNVLRLPGNHISETPKWIIAVLQQEWDHDRNVLVRQKLKA